MKWLEQSVRYASSDLMATAAERCVIGVVGDRAEVYCLDCARGMDLVVVGEVFPDTRVFRDAVCDKCKEPVLKQMTS